MTKHYRPDRRTVLKTLATATAGGTILSGTVSGRGGRARSPLPPDLTITGKHDHQNDQHIFELNKDELGAGWNTIYFDNQTSHTHFAYLAELPQQAVDDAQNKDWNDSGNTDPFDFYYEVVTRPFQWYMDFQAGNTLDPANVATVLDVYDQEIPKVFPPWFSDVQPSGGPGLTAGGNTAKTTVHLDSDQSGMYIVECYVKNSNNIFHSYIGMLDSFSVSDGDTGSEPESTVDLEVSTGGITFPDTVGNGPQTIGVTYADQTVYSHLLGHDAHLIRLDGTTASEVKGWMNWASPSQLISDGTEPGQFLGGVQNIRTPGLLNGTSSETGYVQVNLAPGDYAWVAEVPYSDSDGNPVNGRFYEEFTVTPAGGGNP